MELFAEAIRELVAASASEKSVAELEKLLDHLQSNQVDREPTRRRPRRIEERLAPEQLDEIVARYKAGEGTPGLGRDFGVAEGSINRLLRARGIDLRFRRLGEDVISRASELYDLGRGVQSIATELGVSKTTLLRAMKKAGVRMRPPKH